MPKQLENSFEKGMSLDVSKFVNENNSLTDALNATLITGRNEEVILQNDNGNIPVKVDVSDIINQPTFTTVTLSSGFIPLSVVEYKGVAYFLSLSSEGYSEIGSFPSIVIDDTNLRQEETASKIKIGLSSVEVQETKLNDNISIRNEKVILSDSIQLFPHSTLNINPDKIYIEVSSYNNKYFNNYFELYADNKEQIFKVDSLKKELNSTLGQVQLSNLYLKGIENYLLIDQPILDNGQLILGTDYKFSGYTIYLTDPITSFTINDDKIPNKVEFYIDSSQDKQPVWFKTKGGAEIKVAFQLSTVLTKAFMDAMKDSEKGEGLTTRNQFLKASKYVIATSGNAPNLDYDYNSYYVQLPSGSEEPLFPLSEALELSSFYNKYKLDDVSYLTMKTTPIDLGDFGYQTYLGDKLFFINFTNADPTQSPSSWVEYKEKYPEEEWNFTLGSIALHCAVFNSIDHSTNSSNYIELIAYSNIQTAPSTFSISTFSQINYAVGTSTNLSIAYLHQDAANDEKVYTGNKIVSNFVQLSLGTYGDTCVLTFIKTTPVYANLSTTIPTMQIPLVYTLHEAWDDNGSIQIGSMLDFRIEYSVEDEPISSIVVGNQDAQIQLSSVFSVLPEGFPVTEAFIKNNKMSSYRNSLELTFPTVLGTQATILTTDVDNEVIGLVFSSFCIGSTINLPETSPFQTMYVFPRIKIGTVDYFFPDIKDNEIQLKYYKYDVDHLQLR